MVTAHNRITIEEARQDENLKEEFFKFNMKLVHKAVNELNSVPIEKSEKISLGTYGLLKAFNTYKKESGYAFSTYAMRCIKNEILMEDRKVAHKQRLKQLSLEGVVGHGKDDDELYLMDIIPAEENEYDNHEMALIKEAYKKFVEVYSEIDPRLVQTFNMYVFEDRLTKDIGSTFGLTQSAASRMAARAIKALQDIAIEMELIENYNRYAKKPISGEKQKTKDKDDETRRKILYINFNYPELTTQDISKIVNWSTIKVAKVKELYESGKWNLTPDDSIKPAVEKYLATKIYS